jgi:hypothetical protein
MRLEVGFPPAGPSLAAVPRVLTAVMGTEVPEVSLPWVLLLPVAVAILDVCKRSGAGELGAGVWKGVRLFVFAMADVSRTDCQTLPARSSLDCAEADGGLGGKWDSVFLTFAPYFS